MRVPDQSERLPWTCYISPQQALDCRTLLAQHGVQVYLHTVMSTHHRLLATDASMKAITLSSTLGLLTCQQQDPAEGGSPESTCVAVPLVPERPWECHNQDKHSALEHCQTPDRATICQPSEHSSWGFHIRSLLLYMSCKYKQ